MMTAMVGAVDAGLLAFFDRPTDGSLTTMFVVAALGWALHWFAERSTRIGPIEPHHDQRPESLEGGVVESPALIGLLTNGYDVPQTAITGTVLDLAARGWVRFSSLDGELIVITKTSASAGDSLRPHEQQVLNHIASRAFNDYISAGTLAASRQRLDRTWQRRFSRAVVATSHAYGLSRRRYTALQVAPPAAAAAIGLFLAWSRARGGEEVALTDSWAARGVWLVAIAVLGLLAWHTVQRAIGTAQRPTELGEERTAAWLGFRRRLRDRIPASASAIGSPPQQQALAQAVVMGVAEHVGAELPIAPGSHRLAWSEAGGTPHVVRVRYPMRPGYGQHPLKLGAAGLVIGLLARWLQSFLRRVSEGEALESLIERLPGQVDLIETIAEILSIGCWIPIGWALWAVIAGAVDSVATRERIGSVVRARRPSEVLDPNVMGVLKPFAERDRFTTYIAVDDGRRPSVTAWLAGERNSAPQGAHARVRATPLLGYVRSSEPVGTATRTDAIST